MIRYGFVLSFPPVSETFPEEAPSVNLLTLPR